MKKRLAVLAGAVALAAPPAFCQSAPLPVAAQRQMVNQYCVGCHNDKLRTSGLSLEKLDLAKPGDQAEVLERVIRKLRAGMMPPVGIKRPDAAAYEALIAGMETELDKAAKVTLTPPGLHRLNRTEYANSIRDLLALEVDASKFLPADDSSHGFDNMAGTLQTSSALLEAYMSAAGKIAKLAIGDVTSPSQSMYQVPEDYSQDYHVEGLPFGTRGGMLVRHEFPADADYSFKISTVKRGNMGNGRSFGDVTGEQLEVMLDGVRVGLFDWDKSMAKGANFFEPGTVDLKIPVKAGRHVVGVTFLATNFAPINDHNNTFKRTTIETGGMPGYTFYPHVASVRIMGPFDAKGAADTETRRKIFVCQPAGAPQETACAKQIVANLARHAYRRPVTDADTEVLLSFYQQGRNKGGNFDKGVETALQRLLAEPEFLFRKEREPANVAGGKPYRITDMELASRLSFFLWSSIPDDELINLASQNKLHEPKVLEAQVRRMLASDKSEQFIVNFAGQWLNLRGLQSQSPVAQNFPDFDDNLRQAFRRETELFFASIVREDRGVMDLMNADYTFVNERLAKHYGIPAVYGPQFRRVKLEGDLAVRRGLLGQGSLLTVSSQPGRTSPVQRGKHVFQTILGIQAPQPPPNVPPLKTKEAAAGGIVADPPMRARMEEHRANPYCAACHKLMDPIGFALEKFDAVGTWRTTENGQPIDASSELYDGTKIDGPDGLRQALLKYSPQFVRNLTERLLTYALGRGAEYYDMPLVRTLVKDAGKDNYRFSALLLGIVKSDPFQMNMRTVEPVAQAPEGLTAKDKSSVAAVFTNSKEQK